MITVDLSLYKGDITIPTKLLKPKKLKIKIAGKNWTVNEQGKALIRYGKGLTCPIHIFNFVRYNKYDHNVICEMCGYHYKIEGIRSN